MLWLTGATGQEVRTCDGTVLGRVSDLSVRLSTSHSSPLVSRVLVEVRRRTFSLIDWNQIAGFEHDDVELIDGVDQGALMLFDSDTVSAQLEPDELLLCRDVLDTQIVDVVGHRLARVADVALACTDRGDLEVLAVEIGFGRVLERLRLEKLAGRAPDSSIAWTDLHLTSDRGHLVQLGSPASAVHRLTNGDLAALVARLDLESATEVLDSAGPQRAAGAISHARTRVGERLLRALPDDAQKEILDHMPAEHAHWWRHRIHHQRALRGRRFFRGQGWHHRHGTSGSMTSRPSTSPGDQ
jgi:sporulation protein YlmC with PRC-barrel domain